MNGLPLLPLLLSKFLVVLQITSQQLEHFGLVITLHLIFVRFDGLAVWKLSSHTLRNAT